MDVVSDYESPPARAWQAKNGADVDWSDCRESLEKAMANDDPPPHYTFVFPRRLKKNERDYWRDNFLPWQRERYPDLETLDRWDDLAERLEKRPDLVDRLNDGALAEYTREILAQTQETGINPLASASDLASNPEAAAEQAAQIGRHDPHFAYQQLGGETSASTAALPENRPQFTVEAGHPGEIHNWSITLRRGDKVTSLRAEPRADADVDVPKPWFAPGPEGDALRLGAQISLAKGRRVSFKDEAVGLQPRTVPDRFREMLDDEGRLRKGSLEIGLSEAYSLTISVWTEESDTPQFRQTVPMYRVPEAEGSSAFGCSFHGVIFIFELSPDPAKSKRQRVDLLTIVDLAGEEAHAAIAGLGLIQLLDRAERLRFDCPGLFPTDGFEVDDVPDNAAGQPPWDKVAAIAIALARLSERDGQERVMPPDLDPRDHVIASMIIGLLDEGAIAAPVESEVLAPLPPEASVTDDPASFRTFRQSLPPLAGQPTGLMAEQTLHQVELVQLEEKPNGRVGLRVRPQGPDAAIITSLVESGSQN